MTDSNNSSPSVQQQATSLLAGIPFGNLIGGPLTAAIQAQGQAAMQTVQFIQAVGFTQGSGSSGSNTVSTVTFVYSKANPSGTGTTNMTLTVPLLTIVPIPFIRISNMTISFTANIQADTSFQQSNTNTSNFTSNVSASGGGFWFVPKINFSASYSNSNTSNTTSQSQYNVQYQMNVTVNAVQDSLPGGLQTILNTLLNAVTAQPSSGGGNT